ncbi:hypothetical protein [Methanoregula sp.]|uniref:hypothetical protein n=1 Tax=Methanoregula sp. TaxID=2052170 RepID=UPI003C7114D4
MNFLSARISYASGLVIVVLIILLLASAGCTWAGTSAGNNMTVTASLPGTISSASTVTIHPVPAATHRITSEGDLPSVMSMDSVRNRSFTINGTVPDPSVTVIRIWMIANSTIAISTEPVSPDGTYSVAIPSSAAVAPAVKDIGIIVQFPRPPDHFSVDYDAANGTLVAVNNGTRSVLASPDDIRSMDNFGLTRRIESAIFLSVPDNSCDAYSLRVHDGWIDPDPVGPTTPGSMTVTGKTNMPPGTTINADVHTGMYHPTPKNYDFSHEFASGSGTVFAGTGDVNTFSVTVNTSLLRAGTAGISLSSSPGDAVASTSSQIYPDIPVVPAVTDYVDTVSPALPVLRVNASIVPFNQAGEWSIVEPGTGTQPTDLPYGSIIWCAKDAVCRVFDANGTEFLAVFNTNAEHMMEVLNGGMVGGTANRTVISLGDKVILTKIDEMQ